MQQKPISHTLVQLWAGWIVLILLWFCRMQRTALMSPYIFLISLAPFWPLLPLGFTWSPTKCLILNQVYGNRTQYNILGPISQEPLWVKMCIQTTCDVTQKTNDVHLKCKTVCVFPALSLLSAYRQICTWSKWAPSEQTITAVMKGLFSQVISKVYTFATR